MRDVGVLDIMEAPALLAYIAGEYEPGPDDANDDDLPRYMRERASTICHPTCTCHRREDHGGGR
jgi:choline dehydrogenase